MALNRVPITVAHGDGIGLEIMAASLHIMEEASARIETETIDIGEKVYLRKLAAGSKQSAWRPLRRTNVLCKASIMTPRGGACKSLQVVTRATVS